MSTALIGTPDGQGGYTVDVDSFRKQSETIEVASPLIAVARANAVAYFCEVRPNGMVESLRCVLYASSAISSPSCARGSTDSSERCS